MVKASLKNPHAVAVLALAILVIGVTAIIRLPTDILPSFKTPAVQGLPLYSRIPADVMELDPTARLERRARPAPRVAPHEFQSLGAINRVLCFFPGGIDPYP